MKLFIEKIKEILFSGKSISISVFFLSAIVFTLLLSARYYLYQNIIENGVSKKTIIANKTVTVIDTEETNRRKAAVARKVKPILKPVQTNTVEKNLSNLFDEISSIKKSNFSYNEKTLKLKDLLEVDFLPSSVSYYILNSSVSSYKKLEEEAFKTLSKITYETIIEIDINNPNDAFISENINPNLSKTQHKALTLLIKRVLLPSMIVDDLATDMARRNAINSIKPVEVTFKAGDKVISQGDIASKTEKKALAKLGYNISEINFKSICGIFLLVCTAIFTLLFYLKTFDKDYMSVSYLSLISVIATIFMATGVFLPNTMPVFILPFAAMTFLLSIFTNPRIAILTSILSLAVTSLCLRYSLEDMSVFLISSVFSAFLIAKTSTTRRMNLIKTGFDIGMLQIFLIITIYFFRQEVEDINTIKVVTDSISGFAGGLASGMIALGVLPLLESAFKIITPYGLVELADHNQALLKRLQFEAPGTYHHSLMVSNLAEAAAEAVGADTVLTRVGAFYHDIGKLKRPLFFVENHSYFGIENPHTNLNPKLSKTVITSHPKDGLEIAKEYKLPPVIQKLILQHHGSGIAMYFYKQALEAGEENISKESFRYSCPKPSSREAAILMLADATESAVRALKNADAEEIKGAIEKIIQERLMDGQLSECPLTLKDLETISAAFLRTLRGMQHTRIEYHKDFLSELEIREKLKNEQV